MRFETLAFALLSLALILGFGGWAIWRQIDSERQRWTRYNRPRSSGPKSWVCPNCLTRHYGARAIREQRCQACEEANVGS